MSDDVVSLSVIGQIVRRRWPLLAALAALGAVLGAAASLLLWPQNYQSESQVLLQGKRDESEVRTEAQIAMSLVVLGRTAERLNWGVDGAGLRDSVTAAVVNGNVIEIQATAHSPERARQLADRVTEEYITFSTEIVTKAASASSEVLASRRVTLQQQVDDINRRLSDMQKSSAQLNPSGPEAASARAELQHLGSTRVDAVKELNDVDAHLAQTQVDVSVNRDSISVIEPAGTPSAPLAPTLLQLIAGGAALAAVLGTFVLLAARRADRRLRRSADIAAALGAPVLGTVEAPPEVPMESPTNGSTNGHAAGGLRPLVQRLLRDGAWDGQRARPAREQSLEYLRYQRALGRLHGAPHESVRLLVLVADDDLLAVRAVARLAVAANVGGRPVSLVTDSPQLTVTVEALVADGRPRPAPLTVVPRLGAAQTCSTNNTTVLSVVTLSATLPTVPSCPAETDVLVVVTAGTRTASELIAVAEACHDAGPRVAGVLMVVPNAEKSDDAAEPARLSAVGLWPHRSAGEGHA